MKDNHTSINQFPSEDDFKSYLEGKLNEQQRAEFENGLQSDEFSKTAMEGYKEFPDAFKDLPSIHKSIQAKTGLKNTGFYHYFYFALSLISITLIIYFIYNNQKKQISNNSISESSFQIDTQKLNILNLEIKNAINLPETEQITSIKTQDEQININDFEKDKPLEVIEKIHSISIQGNISVENNTPEIEKHYRYLPTTYMYDFKVVNYSNTYRNKIKTFLPDGGSLSPKYENYSSENLNNDPFEKYAYIAYNDYLNEAMGMFSTNNFKEALNHFNIIIQQYPDDLNAHFYGGLCYYNIGLNGKASDYFNVVLCSNSLTFSQEALWYKSLSLINAEQLGEAKEILSRIIEAHGFYETRARETLKMIK